jgi:hypothetical protein
MSLANKIDKLAATEGFESIIVESDARILRGKPEWHDILRTALDLFKRTDEADMRLIVGKYTITYQREANEIVGVVIATGHPVAKSLRRMIRRAAKSTAKTTKGDKV